MLLPCWYHILLEFTNSFLTAIEHVSQEAKETVLQSPFKRKDRCFLTYRGSAINQDLTPAKISKHLRICLKYHSLKILGREIDLELQKECGNTNISDLKAALPPASVPAFDIMLSSQLNNEEQKAIGQIFYCLSFDNSVDELLPLCVAKHLKQVYDTPNAEVDFSEVSKHAPEVAALLACVSRSETFALLKYLVEFVLHLHSKDIPASDAVRQPGTYNPPKFGRAYYFEPHGEKVRDMRWFEMDVINEKQKIRKLQREGVFDEPPDVVCNKTYPLVSMKGTTHLFAWMCLEHQEFLGMHMIPGSEGPKDAAASVYTHCEVPPEMIMIDHVCGVSEYFNGRERGFSANIHIYHDFFHGVAHKCSPTGTYCRIPGAPDLNSAIMEQFNSYFKRIKTAGKLMSQSHFMFFCQFFAHQWNIKKREVFQKQLRIGAMGML